MDIKSSKVPKEILKDNHEIRDWVRDNRWILFIGLLAAAIATVILVINVRSMNELLVEKQKLSKNLEEIEVYNKELSAKIIELESADRIIPMAETQLNMKQPDHAPKILK